LTITNDFRNVFGNVLSTHGSIWDFWHAEGSTFVIIQDQALVYSVDGGLTLHPAVFAPPPDSPPATGDDTTLPNVAITFVASDSSLWAVTYTFGNPTRYDLYADLDPASTSQFSHVLTAPVFDSDIWTVDFEDISLLSDGALLIANQFLSRTDGRWQSKITWNRGAEWVPLTPPADACTPSDLASIYGCHLHLQSAVSGGHILSSYLAPGVIIGTGTLQLSHKPKSMRLV